MKRFSLRLFALGLALGALGATAVVAATAYANTSPRTASQSTAHPKRHAHGARESGQRPRASCRSHRAEDPRAFGARGGGKITGLSVQRQIS